MDLMEKYRKKLQALNNEIRCETTSNTSKIISSADDLLTEDEKECFEERAAIMEFDGGMSREEAEREAVKLISKRQKAKQHPRVNPNGLVFFRLPCEGCKGVTGG